MPLLRSSGDGYQAGAQAAKSAVDASSLKGLQDRATKGRAYNVMLKSKPFGLVLEQNPSGRGVFVSEVTAGGAAAAAALGSSSDRSAPSIAMAPCRAESD